MGRKVMDITGDRYGKLTAIRRVGSAGPFSLWEFKCDCGGTKIYRAAHIRAYAKLAATGGKIARTSLSCGCDRTNKQWTPGYSQSDRQYWNYWHSHLCDRWKNSQLLFLEECLAKRGKNRYLSRPDRTQPLSPTNFQWVKKYPKTKSHETKERAISIMVRHGWDEMEARKKIFSVSRQRVFQIIWRLTGKCPACGRHYDGGKYRCDTCIEKDRERKQRKRAIA